MQAGVSSRIALTCLCCALVPGEDLVEPVVLHTGTRAAPGANFSYFHDRLSLHPYLLLGGGRDDNPEQQPTNSLADSFFTWAVGGVADLRASVDSRLTVCAAVFQRNYQKTDGRDLSGSTLNAQFDNDGSTVDLQSRISWDRSDDPLVETGRSVRRDQITGSLRALRPGAANRLEAELRAAHVNFLEDALTFSASERDRIQGELRLGYVHLRSQTTEIGVRGSTLVGRYYDSATLYQDSVGWRAEGAGRVRPTPHISLSAALGFEALTYDGPFADNPAYDDRRVSGPVASLTARWDASDGCWFGLSGSSRFIDSTTSNAARLSGIEGSWQQRLGRRASLASYAGVSRRDDVSNGSGPTRQADELQLGSGLTVWLIPGLTGELRLRWRDYRPSDSAQYNQLIGSLLLAYVL